MRNTYILTILCATVVTFVASNANAYQSYANLTDKPCSYCHVNPNGGGDRTPDGEYYKQHGTLPPPPTVTSIVASSGPNSGTTSITNLAGVTFLTGATVKLKRTGYPDITASSVTVVNETKITCTFNLTGCKTGLWDVFVANSDGLTGTLPGGFGIGIVSSASFVCMGSRRLRDPIMTAASAKWRLRVWGKVQLTDSSTFWLDDGSLSKVKVFAPGYSGIVNGSFAAVTGSADVSSSPVTLISSPAQIMKYL